MLADESYLSYALEQLVRCLEAVTDGICSTDPRQKED